MYCNRSCLWVCDSERAGGRCSNLTTASARAVFASLRAVFQSKYDCGRRTDSLKDRQRSNVGGFVVRSQWNRVQLTKHAIWHDDLQAPGGCSSHHLQGSGHIASAALQAAQLVKQALRDAATICPAPYKSTFDLLTSKVVSMWRGLPLCQL